MSKSLIVYFSHNKENYFSGNIVNLEKGNVQVIVETLSTMIDADIYEIKENKIFSFITFYDDILFFNAIIF